MWFIKGLPWPIEVYGSKWSFNRNIFLSQYREQKCLVSNDPKNVRERARLTFHSFLNSDFKAFLMILFERARLGFKRHLLSISFQCSMPRSLKISYWSRKLSHGEGSREGVRKLFKKYYVFNCIEWPFKTKKHFFFARKAWFCIKLKTPIDGITRKKQFNGEKLVVKVI